MMTAEHRKVHEWITKDYITAEYWKDIGKELYLAASGDSNLTRHRLADVLRRSFSKLQQGTVTYERWNDDFSAIVKIEIDTPEIGTSNDAYVDWLRIADYLLLAAASTWPRLEEENQRRKTMYDQALRGFETRKAVMVVAEHLKANPESTDGDIQAAVNREGFEVAQSHVAQARKATLHTTGREIVEREPEAVQQLERYSSLYH